jgi:hypothetical protein
LGVPVVDIFTILNNLRANGLTVGSKHLSTLFLGGLFGLDGIHPTNTGYAVIANEFLKVINSTYGTNFPLADINAVFAADPLAPLVHKRGGDWSDDGGISIFDIMIDPTAFDSLKQTLAPWAQGSAVNANPIESPDPGSPEGAAGRLGPGN